VDIFAEFSDLDEGNVQRDADDALAEVVEAVRMHGKAGTVTLVMSVQPAVRQGVIGVLLAAKVTAKKPERTPEGSFRFITRGGDLVTVNPGQTPLPFNSVSTEVETRTIGDEPAEQRSV
jgi:hypothetical protein